MTLAVKLPRILRSPQTGLTPKHNHLPQRPNWSSGVSKNCPSMLRVMSVTHWCLSAQSCKQRTLEQALILHYVLISISANRRRCSPPHHRRGRLSNPEKNGTKHISVLKQDINIKNSDTPRLLPKQHTLLKIYNKSSIKARQQSVVCGNGCSRAKTKPATI